MLPRAEAVRPGSKVTLRGLSEVRPNFLKPTKHRSTELRPEIVQATLVGVGKVWFCVNTHTCPECYHFIT